MLCASALPRATAPLALLAAGSSSSLGLLQLSLGPLQLLRQLLPGGM